MLKEVVHPIGTLPAGLSLCDSTGIIQGIPEVIGTFNFTIKVTDSHIEPYQNTEQLTLVTVEDVTAIEDLANIIPKKYKLYQNYPNPLNSETTIRYQLAEKSEVRLVIYNFLGEKVKTLVEERQDVGYYSIHWNGTDDSGRPVSSGVYFQYLSTGKFIQTRKMLLLR
jgi:hypothetical protein